MKVVIFTRRRDSRIFFNELLNFFNSIHEVARSSQEVHDFFISMHLSVQMTLIVCFLATFDLDCIFKNNISSLLPLLPKILLFRIPLR